MFTGVLHIRRLVALAAAIFLSRSLSPLPRIDQPYPAAFEVTSIAGGQGSLVASGDRGNLSVRDSDRTSPNAPRRHNRSEHTGSLFIKPKNSAGEISSERDLGLPKQAIPALSLR